MSENNKGVWWQVLLRLIQQAYYGPWSIGAQSLQARDTKWLDVPFSAIATAGSACVIFDILFPTDFASISYILCWRGMRVASGGSLQKSRAGSCTVHMCWPCIFLAARWQVWQVIHKDVQQNHQPAQSPSGDQGFFILAHDEAAQWLLLVCRVLPFQLLSLTCVSEYARLSSIKGLEPNTEEPLSTDSEVS